MPKKSLLVLAYLASFLYSFHYALPIYIESSFIAQYLSTEKAVSLMFSAAAVFTVAITLLFPRILRRFGNYRATLAAMGFEIATLLALAFSTNPLLVIPAFILHQTLTAVIFLNFDSFVERFSADTATGSIRGVFMTVLNIAFVVAPFLAGLMLTDHDFWKVYLAAAVIMATSALIIAKNFRNYIDPAYVIPSFRDTFRIVLKNHDLHSIIFAHFLLSFFYSWMVIYMPIYLNQHIGFSMNEILGIIIPIALLPFVFFEVIVGNIADKHIGEKEFLTAGFIIAAVSTASLSWVGSASVALWAALLFVTRTGASIIEVTTESYFFKQVNAGDAHLITFMRAVRAGAALIAPLLGYLFLSVAPMQTLFLILGLIMLLAVPYTLTIRDTK